MTDKFVNSLVELVKESNIESLEVNDKRSGVNVRIVKKYLEPRKIESFGVVREDNFML